MKIAYILQGWDWWNGSIYYRNYLPSLVLSKLGNRCEFIFYGQDIPLDIVKEFDIIVFSRYYSYDVVPLIEMSKKYKKKTVYDIDDDFENVEDTNPAKSSSLNSISRTRLLLYGCDAITTTTPYFAEQLEDRYHKRVYVVPNGVDSGKYWIGDRADRLRIGWAGGVSHSLDVLLIMESLKILQEKYDFDFCFQGFTLAPLDKQMFVFERMLEMFGDKNDQYIFLLKVTELYSKLKELKNVMFTTFSPAEMFAQSLSSLSFDIGLCPLLDSTFNRSKSCIKFYEYAMSGAVTIASDVIPYNTEVNYLSGNTTGEWLEKIKFLIKDESLRQKLQREQRNYVLEYREMDKVGKLWESAFKEIIEG